MYVNYSLNVTKYSTNDDKTIKNDNDDKTIINVNDDKTMIKRMLYTSNIRIFVNVIKKKNCKRLTNCTLIFACDTQI